MRLVCTVITVSVHKVSNVKTHGLMSLDVFSISILHGLDKSSWSSGEAWRSNAACCFDGSITTGDSSL